MCWEELFYPLPVPRNPPPYAACTALRSGNLNARSIGRSTIGFFLVAVALLSLTGCQLLGKQQTQINDSVVLGSATMDFGKVGLGNSKSTQNKLTNFKTSSVTIVSIAGPDSTFQITGITLPLVLTPGEVAPFTIVFQPSAAGKVTKTVSFGDNSQSLASLQLDGEGIEAGSSHDELSPCRRAAKLDERSSSGSLFLSPGCRSASLGRRGAPGG